MKEEKIDLIAVHDFPEWENMYKIIDFLNKSLKEKGLIFGIKKNESKITINIYEIK